MGPGLSGVAHLSTNRKWTCHGGTLDKVCLAILFAAGYVSPGTFLSRKQLTLASVTGNQLDYEPGLDGSHVHS